MISKLGATSFGVSDVDLEGTSIAGRSSCVAVAVANGFFMIIFQVTRVIFKLIILYFLLSIILLTWIVPLF